MSKGPTNLEKEFCAFIDSLALPNFRGAEMLPPMRRTRKGIRNALPLRQLWPNIVPALVVAQAMRDMAGRLDITSSYRSPDYNAAVGGARNSFHTHFRALDIVPFAVSVMRLHYIALSMRGKKFTTPHTGKVFTYAGGIGKYPTFIHIDDRAAPADF